MRQLRDFEKVLLASLLSLAACALLAYLGMVIPHIWAAWPVVNWPLTLVVPGAAVLLGLVIGVPVVVLVAAPAYAFLFRSGRASFLTAAAVGVVPGLVLLSFDRFLGIPAVAVGLVVGLATHWACSVSPNNSFKPKPLRGSA